MTIKTKCSNSNSEINQFSIFIISWRICHNCRFSQSWFIDSETRIIMINCLKIRTERLAITEKLEHEIMTELNISRRPTYE